MSADFGKMKIRHHNAASEGYCLGSMCCLCGVRAMEMILIPV